MSHPLNIIEDSTKPWYAEGLKFKCTECGQCCTGRPGYTWVSDEEISEMADYLNISIDAFMKRYVRYVNGKLSLLEDHKNFDCIFLKNKKCEIYPVRPKQCRTYPWWPKNLKSKQEWEEASKYCEGINNPQAAVVPFETIEEQLNIHLE